MLEDISFSERPSRDRSGTFGDIYMTIEAHGGSQQYPIPEATALKLLRQLGEIFAGRERRQNREASGHAVEQPKNVQRSTPNAQRSTKKENQGGA